MSAYNLNLVATWNGCKVEELDKQVLKEAKSACSAYHQGKKANRFWDAMANKNQMPDNLSLNMQLSVVYSYLMDD